MRSTEPIVNKIPPAAGLMLLKEGQYTKDPATQNAPAKGGKKNTMNVAIYE